MPVKIDVEEGFNLFQVRPVRKSAPKYLQRRRSTGMVDDVLDFFFPKGEIQRSNDRSYFSQTQEADQELRAIVRHDGHSISRLYAHSGHGVGKPVNFPRSVYGSSTLCFENQRRIIADTEEPNVSKNRHGHSAHEVH